jgi:hypothetical protein
MFDAMERRVAQHPGNEALFWPRLAATFHIAGANLLIRESFLAADLL